MRSTTIPIPPALRHGTAITDGGLETTLVFGEGVELEDFAAFPLLDDEAGRATLRRYFEPYLDIADRHEAAIVVDTPTWRANHDWGHRLGYDDDALAAVNRRAVAFARELAAERADVTAVIDGVVGPRGDGYVVGATMSVAEAQRYHRSQIEAFADAGADLVSAVTMTYADEATGIVRAAQAAGLPVVVSFTVETDGRLPDGASLSDSITRVDDATGGAAAWFMINCAHPSHFAGVLGEQGAWRTRVQAVRANASRMSHEELDEADELDRGDPGELARDYAALRASLPALRVVGGCCGTDHDHIGRIADAVLASP